MLHPQTTLNCRGRLLDLSRPIVMGILNVTPDSFFDGGRYTRKETILDRARIMIDEGATILDIGGMSSRPGSGKITVEEELGRVLPAVDILRAAFPDILLSIDTVHARVAKEAVEAGAHMINDISAGRMDADLYPTVAGLGVPYVLMHMQGSPQTMQKNPVYDDVLQEVVDFMIREIDRLRELGVKDIVIDPGFGFGKTIEHNYRLLANLHAFKILNLPILAGISRKSMITRVLNVKPAEALSGTIALNMAALQQGASILRVHDVKEAMEVIQLWEQLEAAV
jgi:dihydropteroate synthase